MICKKVLYIVILLFLYNRIFSESLSVQIPVFSKTDHTEVEYRIDTIKGIINSVFIDNELVLRIEKNGEGDISYVDLKKNKLLRIHYYDNTIDINNGSTIITYLYKEGIFFESPFKFYKDKLYDLSNGKEKVKVTYLKTESCIILRYHLFIDDNNNYITYRTTGMVPKNSICTNTICDMLNYLILTEFNYDLAISLLPLLYYSNEEIEYTLTNFYEKNNSSYSSNSFLIEEDISYKSENLSTMEGLPWASANGYGIGDVINITLDEFNPSFLILQNGYQNSGKSYLFNANSRVKKIKIRNSGNNKERIYEIWDQKAPQLLSVSKLFDEEIVPQQLEITILEVFNGMKYKDLCINALIPIP